MRAEVVVGLSGGIDSAAALFFLKQRGYQCTGVHLRLAGLPEEEAARQRDEAAAIAQWIDVPFYAIDCRQQFRECVIDYFYKEYSDGRTPNPCVVCNEKVRWSALMDFGDSNGIHLIATGHYARITGQGTWWRLLVPDDRKKDQTYFLYRLSQEQLSRTLFPLGDYKKQYVRAVMETLGLQTATKPDSQEICFLPDGDRKHWFSHEAVVQGGEIVNTQGKVLGHHKGICFYTVGQRKGLGLSSQSPFYVKQIKKEQNRVVVSVRDEVYSTEVNIGQTVWMAEEKEEFVGLARVRNSGPLVLCIARREDNEQWRIKFSEPVWAMAPGQSVVVYQNEAVVFGGIIEK